MLQKLHERIHGFIAWFIVILLIITFTLFGMSQFRQSQQVTSSHVAEVNGHTISRQMFDLNFRRIYAQKLESAPAAEESLFKQQLLNDMILMQVGITSARKQGFDVSLSQTDRMISQIPQFLEKGQFSSARYQYVLSQSLYTHELFQSEIREEMLLNQLRFAFVGTEFVLPNELNKYVELDQEERQYRYISLIPGKMFQYSSEQISNIDIQAYYDGHRSEFMAPEEVSLDYVSLSITDIKARIHPTAEDLNRHYEDNKTSYVNKKGHTKPYESVAALVHAEVVTERAQAEYAAKLEELAEWSYQAPDSLAGVSEHLQLPVEHTASFPVTGGVEGITKDSNVLQAAFSRDVLELGNNSAPIQVDNEHAVVVRVRTHKPVSALTLSQVKPAILEALIRQRSIQATTELGNQIVQAKSQVVRDALIHANHLQWVDVASEARGNAHKDSLTSAQINQLAFSLPVTPSSVTGSALPSGEFVIVELLQTKPGALSALDKEKRVALAGKIQKEQGILDYDVYLSHQFQNAKIVRDV